MKYLHLLFSLLLSTAMLSATKPNIVIFFLDDAGYGDFSPFAEIDYPTPNIQRLADKGTVFTQFFVPVAVCSASRSVLLTGCYPNRTGVKGAFGPRKEGLGREFAILPEQLKKAGYTTAWYGKWHLGDTEGTRPHDRGFDESAGLMYSNDMWKYNRENRNFDELDLQYWENGKITIPDVGPKEQKMLTKWNAEKAVDFISRNKQNPFFIYIAHNQPHVPLFVSEAFEGASDKGIYADVMMEIDWSVGTVLDALEENGLEDNTIVMFSSDNGPWLIYGNHGGKTPFREGKHTSFNGGIQSPCIIKYPKAIPAGIISKKTFCSVDITPTLCKLTGASLPGNTVDGKDVWDIIISRPGATNPHEYYPCFKSLELQGILTADGNWKLHLPHGYMGVTIPGKNGLKGPRDPESEIELSLFNLREDPIESVNLIRQYPELATKLKSYANEYLDRWPSAVRVIKKKKN